MWGRMSSSQCGGGGEVAVVGLGSNVAKAARGAGYSELSQSPARVHLLSKAARQNLPDQSESQSVSLNTGFDNEITF